MPPGDESSGDDGSAGPGPQAAADPQAPARPGSADPAVESVWLGRRRPARPLGRPRLTTVLMVAAFTGLLVLYLVVRPGG
ncbi:hypothetical protein IU449_10880 [Nocardia higoensis]|uniref:Uncharacterized protein n=1 Tax=Nocardia higoensis TaxID=228599 RepID=A0ABS0D988_9NOCA|nr:hypothetical protein [Nocardia higoensis]MBF6355041.1 hypothetical protein [Nocardia higoensis]